MEFKKLKVKHLVVVLNYNKLTFPESLQTIDDGAFN